MAAKHKLVGRVAFSKEPKDSQVYWKCPIRKCNNVHYFSYQRPLPGIIAIYKHHCPLCNKSYTASQLYMSGTSITFAVEFEE